MTSLQVEIMSQKLRVYIKLYWIRILLIAILQHLPGDDCCTSSAFIIFFTLESFYRK